MSYKQNANANREAIFGPSTSTSGRTPAGPSYERNVNDNRAALFGNLDSSIGSGGGRAAGRNVISSSSSSAGQRIGTSAYISSRPMITGNNVTTPASSSSSRIGLQDRRPITTTLTGAAKVAKMKEAEEYREKAKVAIQNTFFSRPDPIAAGSYYRRVS